jgi:hypothetical protein
MRLTGYCESCHRVRPVKVSSAGMNRLAMKQIPTGTCTSCEEKADEERKRRRSR